MTEPITDSERVEVIAAERELRLLATMLAHDPDLSEIAQDSAQTKIDRVRAVLQRFRERYGMAKS